MVERFERQIDVAAKPAAAARVGDPVELTFEILRESYTHYPRGLASDIASREPRDLAETPQDDRYDDGYYSKLYEREGAALARRMSQAATRVGSLWLSAWQDAGRPAVAASFRIPYVRRRHRGALLSIDGAAAVVLDDAVARGLMPNLAALRARGAVAQGSTVSVPSKTAPGHAALFTGAWGETSGISGNSIAVPGASVLEWETGFTSTALVAEPIWVTAARQGLNVSVVSAPQIYPFSPFLQERRFGGNYGRSLTLLDGYQNVEVSDKVFTAKDVALREPRGWLQALPAHDGAARELELSLGGSRVDGLLYDDPADPRPGYDTLLLTLDKEPAGGIRLKPDPARGADAASFAGLTLRLGGGEAGAYFRLFALAPDASSIVLYQTSAHVLRSNKPRVESEAYQASGGFLGNGASRLYERGALGATLAQGGDGTAERRYLETIALVARQFGRLNDFAIERTSFDLLVTYLPYPDEALHTWLGFVDASLPGHDAALGARVRPFLDEALRVVDGYVGRLASRLGEDAVLAIGADHGMVGVNRVFRPNVVLRDAGLLTVRDDGTIDAARSAIVYFTGNSGWLAVNRAAKPGGAVRPEDERALLDRAAAALNAFRDPRTGQPVVKAAAEKGGAGAPEGSFGPRGGDLYLELARGYTLAGAAAGLAADDRLPMGDHFMAPGRREMHAGFTISGPGVAGGANLGVIRQIDVAPTLCALLGLEPPANATGRILDAALAKK